MVKKRGPGRPRKYPLPSPPPSPPPVAEFNQARLRDSGTERLVGRRGWEGPTATNAIETVVQGQRRKGPKKKHWEGEEDDDQEGEIEEDKEVEEAEEQVPEKEENPGNLAAKSRTGTGRSWPTEEAHQHFQR